mmetsp:Transcript_8188/g.14005  ORF Transcript_8188/g.14005 Transcript_8188/m.14005 type:complete len:345 (-) Transcript_8188:1735-2769(-)
MKFASCLVGRVDGDFVEVEGANDEGDGGKKLDEHVDAGSSSVLARIADCVASDGSSVGKASFVAVVLAKAAALDVLLGIVPSTASVVEEESHEDTSDGADHEQTRRDLSTEIRAVGVGTDGAEDEADDNGDGNGEQAGEDHVLQGTSLGLLDARLVVGHVLELEDAGLGVPLGADVFDDDLGGRADGADGQGGEEEDQSGADESSGEDFGDGEVDRAEGSVGVGGDLVHVGGEEKKRGQGGRSDGVALGQGLGGVADGVHAVADGAGLWGCLAHLADAAGVVGDGAEGVHGEDKGCRGEHAHCGDGDAEQAADRDVVLVDEAGEVAEPEGRQDGGGDHDNWGGG